MHYNADYWIRVLNLQSHPEGGYYNEVFAGRDMIEAQQLPGGFTGSRRAYTSIYFLLKSGQVSKLHRLKSDELWNFYAGSPVTIHVIHPDGTYESLKLGPDPEKGEMFQHCVQAGCWFGSTVDHPRSYGLTGCFVAPGFDFEDFELADTESLIREFPRHADFIRRLT